MNDFFRELWPKIKPHVYAIVVAMATAAAARFGLTDFFTDAIFGPRPEVRFCRAVASAADLSLDDLVARPPRDVAAKLQGPKR